MAAVEPSNSPLEWKPVAGDPTSFTATIKTLTKGVFTVTIQSDFPDELRDLKDQINTTARKVFTKIIEDTWLDVTAKLELVDVDRTKLGDAKLFRTDKGPGAVPRQINQTYVRDRVNDLFTETVLRQPPVPSPAGGDTAPPRSYSHQPSSDSSTSRSSASFAAPPSQSLSVPPHPQTRPENFAGHPQRAEASRPSSQIHLTITQNPTRQAVPAPTGKASTQIALAPSQALPQAPPLNAAILHHLKNPNFFNPVNLKHLAERLNFIVPAERPFDPILEQMASTLSTYFQEHKNDYTDVDRFMSQLSISITTELASNPNTKSQLIEALRKASGREDFLALAEGSDSETQAPSASAALPLPNTLSQVAGGQGLAEPKKTGTDEAIKLLLTDFVDKVSPGTQELIKRINFAELVITFQPFDEKQIAQLIMQYAHNKEQNTEDFLKDLDAKKGRRKQLTNELIDKLTDARRELPKSPFASGLLPSQVAFYQEAIINFVSEGGDKKFEFLRDLGREYQLTYRELSEKIIEFFTIKKRETADLNSLKKLTDDKGIRAEFIIFLKAPPSLPSKPPPLPAPPALPAPPV